MIDLIAYLFGTAGSRQNLSTHSSRSVSRFSFESCFSAVVERPLSLLKGASWRCLGCCSSSPTSSGVISKLSSKSIFSGPYAVPYSECEPFVWIKGLGGRCA